MKYPAVKIAPSILACDFMQLGNEIHSVLNAGADWLHIDVMDGHFVPNISVGLPIISSIRKKFATVFLDVHIMVSNPDRYISPIAEAGVNSLTFHIEAAKDPGELIRRIHETGMKAGVTMKPSTPVEAALPYIRDIDMLLIMTVDPGFGGQRLIPECLEKIRIARSCAKNLDLDIQADGGIGYNNAAMLGKSGANVLVSGTSIFGSPNREKVIYNMRRECESGLSSFI